MIPNMGKLLQAFGSVQKGRVTLVCSSTYGTSQPCFSHPLQRLTDEYINDPATRNESNSNREAKDNGDQLTWALGDPPPEESLRPHFQARQTHTDPLIKWILDQGGYIDSHLYIGTSPTLKCRGVLKTSNFPQLGHDQAVMMLPAHIEMRLEHARSGLSTVLSSPIIERIEKGSKEMLLALFLAMEKNKGKHSFWDPYISSLPEQIPCAWALEESKQWAVVQKARIARYSLSKDAVRKAKEKRLQTIYKEQKALGSLKISTEDMTWALGMVESRCYSSPDPETRILGPALPPFLDICNHNPHGKCPGWGFANGVWNVCVTNTKDAPVAEGAGEIFINYLAKQMSKQDFWHKYGIV